MKNSSTIGSLWRHESSKDEQPLLCESVKLHQHEVVPTWLPLQKNSYFFCLPTLYSNSRKFTIRSRIYISICAWSKNSNLWASYFWHFQTLFPNVGLPNKYKTLDKFKLQINYTFRVFTLYFIRHTLKMLLFIWNSNVNQYDLYVFLNLATIFLFLLYLFAAELPTR